MLSEWLSPLSVDEFASAHLGRAPYARPGAATNAIPRLSWDVLERVLAAEPAPDVLVASGGRLAEVPAPRDRRGTQQLMKQNLGVVVRKAERHHADLAELARSFARDLPGEVHVQLYVTPAGTQTFGWHFDVEDVFIVQTEGIKDYYMRANTVTDSRVIEPYPDFSLVRSETSALLSARLIPGDWLYIPSRWWHLVRSHEDALSISIGVIPSQKQLTQATG
jgi:ribosomal protein L16 Arg81 hydroxylase